MSFVHVQYLPEFMWGEDVVMLAMDAVGVTNFYAALSDAVLRGASRLDVDDGVTHAFFVQDGAADVELGNERVVWRLDGATAAAIMQDLGTIGDKPSHQYFDIRSPAETLVISYDEYPPEFFDRFAAPPHIM